MNKQVSYKTPSGRNVDFEIVTQREVDADGIKVTVPCYDLRVTLETFGPIIGGAISKDGKYYEEGINRNVGGKSVNLKITLNDEAKALINEYKSYVKARQDRADKIDREYQDHVNKVDFAMTLNGRTY